MVIARALLHGVASLRGLGLSRVVVAVFALGVLSMSAALAALWIRRRGSPKLKDAMAISLFTVLSVGLFVYWPWRFALIVTLLIGACVGADILKRKGYLLNDGK